MYRVIGVHEDDEQTWVKYLVAVLIVTVVSILVTFLLLRFQDRLPLQSVINPSGFPGVAPDLAMNTAISFATNTNWQNYAGETTMSYFSQMVALVMHNFLSAATGLALAIALIRGLARRSGKTLGSFYVDVTRGILYVLLPLSIIGGLVFVSQGVIQNFSPSDGRAHAQWRDPDDRAGPRRVAGDHQGPRQQRGRVLQRQLGASVREPQRVHQRLHHLQPPAHHRVPDLHVREDGRQHQAGARRARRHGRDPARHDRRGHLRRAERQPRSQRDRGHPGGQLDTVGRQQEGKEVRFGIPQSSQFVAATTGTSTGSVDASHDSLTAIGGLVPLLSIQLGEITPGGIGAGLYGMLMFVILGVFIAGLMVGRTPEYLGKKIEARDVKLAALAILILPLSILGLTAVSVLVTPGQAGPLNAGPHGFSEILYAFSSATGNNGSAFAGLTGNTVYYNTTLEIGMWLGRYLFVIPIMALAGSMVRKKIIPASAGTFPTDTPLFAALLVGVVLVVGALTFFPALALGPILEHFQIAAGHLH